MNHTQQLFNSAERKGSRTDGGGIKGQVGSLYGDPSLHMGPQPDHTTTAKFTVVRHGDKREGPATQWVTGIDNGNGGFR